MPYQLNPFTGQLDYYGVTAPAGSSGDVQFNNAGAFGGIAQTLLTVDRSALRFGFFTNAPSVPFHISSPTALVQYTAIDGSVGKLGGQIEATTTDSGSTVANRLFVSCLVADFAANPASTKVVSALAGALSTPTGNATTLTNVSFRVLNATGTHKGTGTIKDVIGGNYSVANNSTGTITNATGMKSNLTVAAGGFITTYKGVEAVDVVNAGTIGQTYQFYAGLANVGVNTNKPYAFYNADPDAVNYFLGATVPRVTVAADATSITPDTRYCNITQQTNTQAVGTLTINADAGISSPQPYNGQPWMLKIKSTNVQTFAWNACFIGGIVALETVTSGGGLTDLFSFLYDTIAAKWAYTGKAAGF